MKCTFFSFQVEKLLFCLVVRKVCCTVVRLPVQKTPSAGFPPYNFHIIYFLFFFWRFSYIDYGVGTMMGFLSPLPPCNAATFCTSNESFACVSDRQNACSVLD